jgi:hypothetical protein
VAPGDPDEHGTVRVLVDGEERQSTEVSASSIFASALALREIDLSGLPAGRHEIEVRYDGRTQPRVELEVRRWVGGGTPPPPAEALSRRAPERCAVGQSCAVVIEVPSTLSFPALIEQPLGDAFELDRDALEDLRARGALSWHELSNGLLRVAVPTRTGSLTLPLRATRTGHLVLAPTRASRLAGGPTLHSEPAPIDSR